MKFHYDIETPVLLKTFLQEQFYSKKMISAIKQNGALLVNKQPVTVRKQMTEGDTLEVVLPEERPSKNLIYYHAPLDVLYEDDYYLAVSKPAHQNCAPSREHPHESLIEQVLAYLNPDSSQTVIVPHIVTRLDRNTQGIVLFSKHGHFHHRMSDVKMEKIYQCICFGLLSGEGDIIVPIARKSDSIIERQVNETGKYAKTSYQTLSACDRFTLSRVQLHTGRTHQIRVHFQYMDHPLVGDSLYGGTHPSIQGQALVCTDLKFIHPVTHISVVLKDSVRQKALEDLFQQLCRES